MTYIVLAVLNEVRPMWFYILSAALFVLSQLDYFLLSKVICKVCHVAYPLLPVLTRHRQGASAKVDGSFVATFLETASVGVLYLAWKSITEGTSPRPTSSHFVVADPRIRIMGRRRLLPLMSRARLVANVIIPVTVDKKFLFGPSRFVGVVDE